MYLVTFAQPKAMNCSKYFLHDQIHSNQIHPQNHVVNVGFYDITPVALILSHSRFLSGTCYGWDIQHTSGGGQIIE